MTNTPSHLSKDKWFFFYKTIKKMSIAISATVKPSRQFLLFVTAMACFFIWIAVYVQRGKLGEFILYGSEVIVIANGLAVVLLIYAYMRYRKNFQINISGKGQIHVREIGKHVENENEENTYQIIKGSTILPHLLFLHLKSETGKKIVVHIFPDSVSRVEFRALYVACRWITAHHKEIY